MPPFSANLLLTLCSFWWSPTSHNLYFPFYKGSVHGPASRGMDTEQEVGGPWQGRKGRQAGLWKRNPKPNWEGAGINLASVTFNLTEFYPVSSNTHTFSSPQVALFCPASHGLLRVFFFYLNLPVYDFLLCKTCTPTLPHIFKFHLLHLSENAIHLHYATAL